ncbi:MAG: hydrogenase maturation protease [Pseudomonadota bacterium]|jgi:hydrogenase maturation protease
MQKAQIAIIGCGNSNRSDDGVGPSVIALLRSYDLPKNVTLFDAGTDGMGVMYQAKGCSHLIIIDAKLPESSPGAIYEVPGDILASPPPQSLNLHDFRWDHALFAGKKIYESDFPKNVKVFLIEARSIDYGLELSDEVSSSASEIAKKIEALVSPVSGGSWS